MTQQGQHATKSGNIFYWKYVETQTRFAGSGYFERTPSVQDEAEAAALLDSLIPEAADVEVRDIKTILHSNRVADQENFIASMIAEGGEN